MKQLGVLLSLYFIPVHSRPLTLHGLLNMQQMLFTKTSLFYHHANATVTQTQEHIAFISPAEIQLPPDSYQNRLSNPSNSYSVL